MPKITEKVQQKRDRYDATAMRARQTEGFQFSSGHESKVSEMTFALLLQRANDRVGSVSRDDLYDVVSESGRSHYK